MSQENQKSLNDQVILVSPKLKQFSGYRRSRKEDIEAAGGKLPDTPVLTKGGKRVFPTTRLSPFGNLKKAIERELWKIGVRAMGSGVWAVPVEKLEFVEQLLEDGEHKFNDNLNNFKANYDVWLQEYISDNPNEAAIISASALTVEQAAERFGYSYAIFKINPVGNKSVGGVSSMLSELVDQAFTEVAQAAGEAFKKSFAGKSKVGQKSLHQLRACADKLRALEFLDPSISGAAQAIDGILVTLPQAGYIEDLPGQDYFSNLNRLVQIMADEDKLAEVGRLVASGTTPMNAICPAQQVTTPIEEGLISEFGMFTTPAAPQQDAVSNENTAPADVPVPQATEDQDVDQELMFF